MQASEAVTIRAYRGGDDAAATYQVFRSAIIETASADYDSDQIAAWVGPEEDDLADWDARRRRAHTFVAEADGEIVGFADFRDDSILDMLFVRPDHGGRGVARQLVDTLKREAAETGLRSLVTYSSRTARPAFERFGFTVLAERADSTVRGVVVPNYEMRCELVDQSAD